MDAMPSNDKSSDGSECVEPFESDTVGQSSTSGASELKNNRDYLIHKVTKFDTLAGLAIRYGLSVFDIKKANGLIDDRGIFGRESLIIPLSPDQGRMGRPDVVDWNEACCSKDPPRRFKPSTSRWSTFVPIDDSNERTISEIELEFLDEDSAMHRRHQELISRHEDVYNRRLRSTVATDARTGSMSDYFSSMASSLMKTTESLFSGNVAGRRESFFEKMKRNVSRSNFWNGEAARKSDGETGMGSRKASEGNMSNRSGKESMIKMD